MMDPELKKFLIGVANSADELYRRDTQQWQRRIRDFYKRLTLWREKDDAAVREMEKYREEAIHHPVIPADTGEVPNGWVREKVHGSSIVRREVNWPTHRPLDWLCLPEWMAQLHPDACYKPERAATDTESLLGCYVLLTIIHDNMLTGPRTPQIHDGIWPDDEDLTETWENIRDTHKVGNLDVSLEVNNEIECAIKRVEDDFKHKRQGAEKNGDVKAENKRRGKIPASGGRVGNFFWKLYEKTLKVFVDGVLEKVWPK